MDSRQAAMLLVLLIVTGWGQAEGVEGPGGQEEERIFSEEDGGFLPPQDAQTPGSLLSFLLQAMQRRSRTPAFLFQPQRFGRNAHGSWSNQRLSPRAREGPSPLFWNLAAPQRFGKK